MEDGTVEKIDSPIGDENFALISSTWSGVVEKIDSPIGDENGTVVYARVK